MQTTLLVCALVGDLLFVATFALNLELLKDEDAAVEPSFARNAIGELNVALSASICRYCICDVHSATVICNSERRMRLKVVSLPAWAETFRAHNLTMLELPHFTYHSRLKTLRINFCSLKSVQAQALLPLPALETLDFADNALTTLPDALLQHTAHLKTLNLARNHFSDLAALEFRLPSDDFVLNEFVLSGNPISGASKSLKFAWPAAKRLRIDASNAQKINDTHITFKGANQAENSLRIPLHVSLSLEVLDLSDNAGLRIDASALSNFVNLSALSLRNVHDLPGALLTWIQTSHTKLRRLDVNGARFTLNEAPLRVWRNYCGTRLIWLDVSNMELEELELDSECKIQWLFADNNRISRVKIHRRANDTPQLKTLHLNSNRLEKWPLILTDEDANFEHNGGVAATANFYEMRQFSEENLKARTSIDGNNRRKRFSDDMRRHHSRKKVQNLQRKTLTTNLALSEPFTREHNEIFSAFGELEVLSLANNSIEGEISCDALSALPLLVHLDVSMNRISAICDDDVYVLNNYDGFGFALKTAQANLQLKAINSRLEFLNASGNLLQSLTHLPRLPALAVLDASKNSLGVVDFCALFQLLPSVQHLHLTHNTHLALRNKLQTNCGSALVSSEQAAPHLVDLDLANCALKELPDLSRFSRLSAVNLAQNFLRHIDAQFLPPCVVALDLSENRIEKIENFTDTQTVCMRHFNLARNSLRCSCSVLRYSPVLQQQDEYYDRTEYYCFTSDGWQHPLSAFLDANAEKCRHNDDAEADADEIANGHIYYRNAAAEMLAAAARTIRFIGIFLVVCAMLSASVLAALRFCRIASAARRLSPISYKLIAQADAPVNL